MLVIDVYKKSAALIHQSLTIKEAMQIMVEKSFNGLLVVDNNETLVGILSLQDIAVAIVPPEMQLNPSLANAMNKPSFFEEACREAGKQRVSQVMRTDYKSADLLTPILEIAADFIEHDLHMVAVIDKGNIVGIVTRTEIKKAIAQGMGIKIPIHRT